MLAVMVKIASVARGTIVLTKFNTCKCPKFFEFCHIELKISFSHVCLVLVLHTWGSRLIGNFRETAAIWH